MELTPAAFTQLRTYLHRACGLALADEKRYLVEQRLGPVIRAHQLRGFDDLARRLNGTGPAGLADEVVAAMTTHETAFFRDGHPFATFRQHLLPGMVERWRARGGGRLRLWCAGASTGQEPYSLAMLLLDDAAAGGGMSPAEVSILATDISPQVLAAARAGAYQAHEIERGLTPELLRRHFRRAGDRWLVNDAVRRLVEFRPVNLIQPLPPLGPFDAIFCRNVLIYFDAPTRQRVVDQLHQRLVPDGWLILGAAESLYGLTTAFASVHLGETLVYRREEPPSPPAPLPPS
jgi:chemotaxis protein methyltransferase CheR